MFIPGRIEILGKHTDYCGGSSIVCATERGFHADVEPRDDRVLMLDNRDSGETVAVDLRSPKASQGHWANYAVEVVRRVAANFCERPLKGVTVHFHSDLPKAAGLSSSSALMIMIFAGLDGLSGLSETPAFRENVRSELDLAEYLACVENGRTFRNLAGAAGVGTFGGSQDHAAILLGKPDTLSRFAFSPLRAEGDLAFPDDLVLAVASSGVTARKTGSALESYNRLSRMAADITTATGGRSLAATIDELGIDAVRNRIRGGSFAFLTQELLDRLEQFWVENYQIIPAVSELLSAGRTREIGELVDLSQQNAERLLGNQIDETIGLARTAREIGAVAASAFGAGFGGSVYAIVDRADAERFVVEWKRLYLERSPQHRTSCEFFTTRPSQVQISQV